MDTNLAIAGAAGLVATVLTEVLNRATPSTKFQPKTLQAIALTVAAAGVVGFQFAQGHGAAIDWNAVIPQVIGAWSVALAVHDVASPRKEVSQG